MFAGLSTTRQNFAMWVKLNQKVEKFLTIFNVHFLKWFKFPVKYRDIQHNPGMNTKGLIIKKTFKQFLFLNVRVDLWLF